MTTNNSQGKWKVVLKLLSIVLSGLTLAACGNVTVGSFAAGGGSSSNSGGNGGGTSPTSPTPSITIDSLSVQGTNGATAVSQPGNTPGNASINGNQNNGVFGISWMTSTNSGAVEQITVSLSTSAQGANADQIILARNCNLPGTECSATSARFQCRFDAANMEVDCPLSSTSPSDQYAVGSYFANVARLLN